TLGVFLWVDSCQLARVVAGYGDYALFLEGLRKGFGGAEVRYPEGTVTHHQPRGMDAVGFDVFFIHARIADMRIGKRDDLPVVARVGQDLLITRHGRVEDNLGDAITIGADRDTPEDGTVRQGKNG